MVDYPKIRFERVKKVKKELLCYKKRSTNFSKIIIFFSKIIIERANFSSTILNQLYGLYILILKTKSFENKHIL